MKSIFRSLILSVGAFVGFGAVADHAPYSDHLVLARVQQLPSQGVQVLHEDLFNPAYKGLTLDVLVDGRVFVVRRFEYKGDARLYYRHAFQFDAHDIARYQRSISRLDVDRGLVLDEQAPLVPGSGYVQYGVRLAGHLTTIEESGEEFGTRIRAQRSSLEVAVIDVLKDLLKRYWDESFPQ